MTNKFIILWNDEEKSFYDNFLKCDIIIISNEYKCRECQASLGPSHFLEKLLKVYVTEFYTLAIIKFKLHTTYD